MSKFHKTIMIMIWLMITAAVLWLDVILLLCAAIIASIISRKLIGYLISNPVREKSSKRPIIGDSSKFFEFLLDAMIPHKRADELREELPELKEYFLQKYGPFNYVWPYNMQIILMIVSVYTDPFIRLVKSFSTERPEDD